MAAKANAQKVSLAIPTDTETDVLSLSDSPPQPTEEEATQRYRDLLTSGEGSAEFKNFAEGMKCVLSVPSTAYSQQSEQAKKKKKSGKKKK